MPKDIKSYTFKPGFRHEIEMLPVEKIYNEHHNLVTQPHRTDFYHVFWFQQAPPEHLVDFKRLRNLNNSLVFINKHQVQIFHKNTKVRGKLLLFTDAFFAKSAHDLQFINSSILFNHFDTAIIKVPGKSHLLIDCFTDIEEELMKNEDGYTYDILKNLLHTFLLQSERELRRLGHQDVKQGADLDYTTLFKDLVNNHFKTVKSVSGYADQMNVSEKRLTNATKKIVGKTPKELIDDRVMLEAKRLLTHTNNSIKQIGYELGFEEPTNFIKFFKKHAAKTPIGFREIH